MSWRLRLRLRPRDEEWTWTPPERPEQVEWADIVGKPVHLERPDTGLRVHLDRTELEELAQEAVLRLAREAIEREARETVRLWIQVDPVGQNIGDMIGEQLERFPVIDWSAREAVTAAIAQVIMERMNGTGR